MSKKTRRLFKVASEFKRIPQKKNPPMRMLKRKKMTLMMKKIMTKTRMI